MQSFWAHFLQEEFMRNIVVLAIVVLFAGSSALAQSTSRSDGMGGYRHSDGSTSRPDGMGGWRHSD